MWHIWDLEFLQTSLVTTLWSLSDIIMFLTRSCSLLSSPHAHSTIQPGCRTWPWPVSTPIFSALAWDQVSLLPGFYMQQVQNVSVLKHTFETKCHRVLLSTHFTYLDQHIYYILGVCKSVIQWLYWYVILIYLTSTVLFFFVFFLSWSDWHSSHRDLQSGGSAGSLHDCWLHDVAQPVRRWNDLPIFSSQSVATSTL